MKRLIQLTALVFVTALSGVSAQGEVVSDGTLGPSGELTGPAYQITESWGTRQGDNLYYSFSRFNIDENEIARFSALSHADNFITRVTGGEASLINGTLQCDIEGANLWLLNPSGLIFGKHASLDINGSFYASTCDYLSMEDGEVFYTDPSKESVLSVAEPESFGFLTDTVSGISFQGRTNFSRGISVGSGNEIFICGGNITLDGLNGSAGANISAPGGKITLASVNNQTEINRYEGVSGGETNGTVEMVNNALINVSGEEEGEILIRAGKFFIDESIVRAGSPSPVTSGVVNSGQEGAVVIEAREITLDNGGSIESSATGERDAGYIEIHGCESLELKNGSRLTTATEGAGDAGNIFINAGNISMDNGSVISSASTLAGEGGHAGSVHIEGAERVTVSNTSTINSSSAGDGNAGYIAISTRTLTVEGESSLKSSNAGALNPEFPDFFDPEFDDEDGFHFTDPTDEVEAPGGIYVEAEAIKLHDKSVITTSTKGEGIAGEIELKSNTLEIGGGSEVNSSSTGPGSAGYIELHAGAITIKGQSTISSSRDYQGGNGIAGTIHIDAGSSLNILDGSAVMTESTQAGGGLIEISAGNAMVVSESRISTEVRSGGNRSGDILMTPGVLILDSSTINARAHEGDGGNIGISADFMIMSPDSTITASSRFGFDGIVDIDAPESELPAGFSMFTVDMLEAEKWTKTPCENRSGDTVSSFYIIRKGLVSGDYDILNRKSVFLSD